MKELERNTLANDPNFDLKVFENSKFGALTVLYFENEPWFIAKEVVTMLGYADTVSAIKQHCKGVVKRHPLEYNVTFTKGMNQRFNTIPEGDFWRLLLRSNLKKADPFQRWVCEEVLPSIRKHGAYLEYKASLEETEAGWNKAFEELKDRHRAELHTWYKEVEDMHILLAANPVYFPLEEAEWLDAIFAMPTTERRITTFWKEIGTQFRLFNHKYENGHYKRLHTKLKGQPHKRSISREGKTLDGYHILFLDHFRELLLQDQDILHNYRSKDYREWAYNPGFDAWFDITDEKSYHIGDIRRRYKKKVLAGIKP